MKGYIKLGMGLVATICLIACGSETGENTETEAIDTQEQAASAPPSLSRPQVDAGPLILKLKNPLDQPCIQCPDKVWRRRMPEPNAP